VTETNWRNQNCFFNSALIFHILLPSFVSYLVDNQITNSVFLIVSILVAVAVLRFNVGNLILALASVLVSFAFMIGTASSKYVEVRSCFVLFV
jgi:hypothetical protein